MPIPPATNTACSDGTNGNPLRGPPDRHRSADRQRVHLRRSAAAVRHESYCDRVRVVTGQPAQGVLPSPTGREVEIQVHSRCPRRQSRPLGGGEGQLDDLFVDAQNVTGDQCQFSGTRDGRRRERGVVLTVVEEGEPLVQCIGDQRHRLIRLVTPVQILWNRAAYSERVDLSSHRVEPAPQRAFGHRSADRAAGEVARYCTAWAVEPS